MTKRTSIVIEVSLIVIIKYLIGVSRIWFMILLDTLAKFINLQLICNRIYLQYVDLYLPSQEQGNQF